MVTLDPHSHPVADLVPVYHLGNTQLLSFWGNEAVSRRWRVCFGLLLGRWGLPLPRRHPIITLVGAPVPGAACTPENSRYT